MKIPFDWRTMAYGFLIVCIVVLFRVANYYKGNYQEGQKQNAVLVAAVDSRDKTITGLKSAASADRRATEEQLKIEQQKRANADAENKTLRKALESSDCNHKRMPDDVINILRK